MTIDVASLVFEIDSTQAVVARERLEALEQVGGRVDVSARKVKTATEMAGIGMAKNAAGAKDAARAATDHANSLGVVEKAAQQAERAATRAANREVAEQARIEAAIVKRNAAYRGDLAVAALKAEAAATLQLDRALASAVQGHDLLVRTHGRAVGSSKAMTQATLNLGRQAADVGVQAAMLTNPLMILIMQGPQIADAFATAKTQGLGFSQVLKGLALSMGLITVSIPPAIAEAAALATAEQAAALAAVEVAIANRAAATSAVASASANQALASTAAEAAAAEVALATATTGQAAANRAATAAAAQLATANEVVARTATQAAIAETVALAPLAAVLAGIAVTIGLVFGGAALAARSFNKDNKDLAAGLGLTQDQLDRLEKKGVNTAVTIGDVFKGTFNYIRDAVAPALAPIGKWFSDLFDGISSASVATVKVVGGAFIGAYAAIKATWSALPAALGDIAVQTGNAVVRAIEDMLNKALAAYNKALPLIRGLMTATGNGAGAMALREAGPVELGKIANPWEGAAGKAIAEGTAAFKKTNENWADTVDSVGNGLRKSILDAAGKRIEKLSGDAGKAPKTPKGAATPRDMNDERLADLDKLLAQAAAEELQARLALTEGTQARANIEKEVLAAQMDVKRAELAKLAANATDAKGITEATRGLMLLEIEAARISAERTGAMREELIDRNATRAITKEAYSVDAARLESQVDLLASQRDVVRHAYQRRALDLKILDAQQKIARMKLDEVIATTAANSVERKVAEERKAELIAIQANQTKAAVGDFQDTFRRATDALDDVSRAFESKDWNSLANTLVNAIGTLKAAFGKAGTLGDKIAGAASLANMAGQAIGGKAGSALSGAAGGAMAGAQLGSIIPGIGTAVGAVVGGILGGVTSLLGGSKADKKAKADREAQDIANARQVAQERANQQAEMELRILELSGDEVGALARRREAELAALDGANRALAEHIHKLEDWASAVAKATDAVSAAEDDLRDAYEAEKDRLLGVIGGVDTARDRLRDAYQRERSAIEGTITSVRSLVESFADFRRELDMMAVANDPSRQYGYAQGQFAAANDNNLIERGRAFADASQSASATDLDFQRDLAAVRRRTDEASKTAQTQLTTAERQLLALDAMVAPLLGANDNLLSVDGAIRGLLNAEQEAALATEELARLDAQVGALITINSSVLSVTQAVNNLQGALGALAAAQAAKPAAGAAGGGSQVVGLAGYIDLNPDLAALYASGTGMAAGRTKEQLAQYHWERYGQGESRAFRPFARGGAFTNGVVNQATAFDMGVMGEAGPEAIMPLEMGPNGLGVRSRGGGDTAKLEALVEELTEKVVELTALQRNDNLEIKRNTKDSAGILAKVTQGSDTVRVKAA